jgi:hypothetical protein
MVRGQFWYRVPRLYASGSVQLSLAEAQAVLEVDPALVARLPG